MPVQREFQVYASIAYTWSLCARHLALFIFCIRPEQIIGNKFATEFRSEFPEYLLCRRLLLVRALWPSPRSVKMESNLSGVGGFAVFPWNMVRDKKRGELRAEFLAARFPWNRSRMQFGLGRWFVVSRVRESRELRQERNSYVHSIHFPATSDHDEISDYKQYAITTFVILTSIP